MTNLVCTFDTKRCGRIKFQTPFVDIFPAIMTMAIFVIVHPLERLFDPVEFSTATTFLFQMHLLVLKCVHA